MNFSHRSPNDSIGKATFMDILDQIATHRVVPVIVIENADDALPLADALLEGGLPVAEITVRTEAAIDAIRLIAKHRPDMLVGAGTVLTEDQVHAVQAAGAAFALAPGTDSLVLSEADRVGLPFVPGVLTPSDIQTALRAGCRRVKFFPAAASGGLDMLKSLAAPYRHTGLRFNPTGGITPETMNDWLNHDFVFAVGGSWIASASDISEHRWDRIVARAEAARQVAQG